MRRKWILLAVFVAHIESTKTPKCVMFGEHVGGAKCVGEGFEKSVDGVSPRRPAFGIDADQWTTAAQDEGERRKTAGQGRKFSWGDESLQRKPELDYGMQ